jgi:hypothetical protein
VSQCHPDRSFLATREPPLRSPARASDFPLRAVQPLSPAWFLPSVLAEQTLLPLLRLLLMISLAVLTLLGLALLLGIPALTSFFSPIWRPPKTTAPSVKLSIFCCRPRASVSQPPSGSSKSTRTRARAISFTCEDFIFSLSSIILCLSDSCVRIIAGRSRYSS